MTGLSAVQRMGSPTTTTGDGKRVHISKLDDSILHVKSDPLAALEPAHRKKDLTIYRCPVYKCLDEFFFPEARLCLYGLYMRRVCVFWGL
jgi:hypothetical protein